MRNQRKFYDLSHMSVSHLGFEPSLMITVTLAEPTNVRKTEHAPFDYIMVLKL